MARRTPSSLASLTISIISLLQVFVQASSQSPWTALPPTVIASLNGTVNGRLFKGFPLAMPCSTSDSFDTPTCDTIQAGYLDEEFRSGVFGAYINPQWETCQTTGDQCLLDSKDPRNPAPMLPPHTCKSGSVPSYFIDVTSEQDVQTAFEFSKRTKVPLVVKNTGHDYKGRSSAPNSLALWTHNLKNISYSQQFVPEGCSSDQAKPGVSVGAGIQWHEAYAFAEANNITLVGGSDRSVGASGGWLQGGGHSMLSNTLGLGVDRVLQFKVVTPDGQYRIANECQNQDLFFALRGGGGGTFGVVLESTTLASPQFPVHVAVVSLATTNGGKVVDLSLTKRLWSVMVSNGIKWASEGWGGAASSSSAIYVIRGDLFSEEEANQSMRPLLDFGHTLQEEYNNNHTGTSSTTTNTTGSAPQVVTTSFPSWGTFFDWFADNNVASVGVNVAIASRLIPKDNFSSAAKQTSLIDALVDAKSTADNLLILIDAPSSYPDPHEETSVTEAWRNSLYHVTLTSNWNWDATSEDKRGRYKSASSSADKLRRITPDAAYSNEADVYEPNHEVSFWGSNYDRLLEIKRKYDPENLLDCWHCVGWKKQAPQFSCYFKDI
ncbi:FAD-binding domain-containing protein [Dendrothele bispora CBS 962.96]|uniref:FAD-binding domain-containing protein n=1 Tax=Dendrothele bispora (strain CBS 962.96) TaxID=1314807 RepID=A0A4S8MM00_DENBC|nr:FAD-binding domain-containing protein [Dendrothele bispora CBS 962.96]